MVDRCDLVMMKKPCHSVLTDSPPSRLSKLFRSSFLPSHSIINPQSLSPSSRSCSVPKAMAMVFSLNREENSFGLQWQPLLRFDKDDLIAEAPFLHRNCEDLDWEKQAHDLRALANLSLQSIRKTRETENKENGNEDTWFSAGLALVVALVFDPSSAFGADETIQQIEAAEAASRAPTWLAPSLLAFPLVSYALFNVYRTQVNPYAKVSDWLFGVAAVVIIANLVLISTIGVRLY